MAQNPEYGQPDTPPAGPGEPWGSAPPLPPKSGVPMALVVTIVIVVVGVVSVAVCGVLAGILLPALGKARQTARELKDSTQVRGTHMGMMSFAAANRDQYPLPSVIDARNGTINSANPLEKDTTGNILSILVFLGFAPTDMMVSPAESNPSVKEHEAYEFDAPSRAASPRAALWDPAFNGTPLDTHPTSAGNTGIGNTSYAHLIPLGARRGEWSATFRSDQVIVGNRGPDYTGQPGKWALTNGPTGTGSNTLIIHGSRTRWEGNMARNDGMVVFETKPDPDDLTFTFGRLGGRGPMVFPDNLFVCEDDATGAIVGPESMLVQTNRYLRGVSSVRSAGNGLTLTIWVD